MRQKCFSVFDLMIGEEAIFYKIIYHVQTKSSNFSGSIASQNKKLKNYKAKCSEWSEETKTIDIECWLPFTTKK